MENFFETFDLLKAKFKKNFINIVSRFKNDQQSFSNRCLVLLEGGSF